MGFQGDCGEVWPLWLCDLGHLNTCVLSFLHAVETSLQPHENVTYPNEVKQWTIKYMTYKYLMSLIFMSHLTYHSKLIRDQAERGVEVT